MSKQARQNPHNRTNSSKGGVWGGVHSLPLRPVPRTRHGPTRKERYPVNQYQELYKKKQMSAEQALELIQDGDSMFSAQAAAEPQAILSKLQHL